MDDKNKVVEDKRRHPRTAVEDRALISAEGSVIGCVVRNVSVEGAAIDVVSAAAVPRRFRLIMSDSSVKDCNTVWINQNRIGVSFE